MMGARILQPGIDFEPFLLNSWGACGDGSDDIFRTRGSIGNTPFSRPSLILPINNGQSKEERSERFLEDEPRIPIVLPSPNPSNGRRLKKRRDDIVRRAKVRGLRRGERGAWAESRSSPGGRHGAPGLKAQGAIRAIIPGPGGSGGKSRGQISRVGAGAPGLEPGAQRDADRASPPPPPPSKEWGGAGGGGGGGKSRDLRAAVSAASCLTPDPELRGRIPRAGALRTPASAPDTNRTRRKNGGN
ncbi:hypothetical protein NL676_019829 [Syzygium grande]|nr:hypothetical protein NL676_019829 [Syzygium grande]